MPALLLAWAGLLGASLAAAPSLEAGVTVEGRSRTTMTQGGSDLRVAEAELAPWLRLGLTSPDFDLVTEYRPLLTLTDVGGGGEALLHQASILGAWRTGSSWLASARLEGRMGTINAYQLMAADLGAGGTVQLVPPVSSLGFRAAEGTLGLGVTTGPRQRLQFSLGAGFEGGATPQDQRWLPLQQRLHGLATLEWDAGPHDVLVSLFEVTTSQFSSGPDVGTALLTETWRRVVSSSLRVWIGGGPAVAAQRSTAGTMGRLLPAGETGLGLEGQLAGLPTTATLAVTLAPFVDRVTGNVPQRIGATAVLEALPARSWRLAANASAGRVLDGPQLGDQAWAGGAQLGRQLGERVELALGVRGLMQLQPRYQGRTVDWYGFISLAVHTRRPDAKPPDPEAVEDPLHPKPKPTPEEQH